uniref:Large ribosomal subunit protein bL20c n=1 Tax=Onchocerca volvulus TaxID=6282 RepID=A0A8R1Y103_ONCVO
MFRALGRTQYDAVSMSLKEEENSVIDDAMQSQLSNSRNSKIFSTGGFYKQNVEKALLYSYRDRKNRKCDFRSLWIIRINAAVREHGFTYGRFIHGLMLAGIDLNRKILAEMAVNYKDDFTKLVETASSKLGTVCSEFTE